MIVHLGGSSGMVGEDLDFMRRIMQTSYENGATIAYDWVDSTYNKLNRLNGKNEDADWDYIVDMNLNAIRRSEAVIIECSSYSLFQGYQIAVALQQKKPVLVVTRSSIKGRAISGIRDKLLSIKEYKTEEELDAIVKQFIHENTISTKDLRFNMFIDRRIYNYLREESYQTGKNRSEIIRDLLEREIDRNEK